MRTKHRLTILYGPTYEAARVIPGVHPKDVSDAFDWCLYKQPGLVSHGGAMQHHPELSKPGLDVWTVRSNNPAHDKNIFYLSVNLTLPPY